MTELAMLRTPNKPLEQNHKVVSIYLLLMLLTFAMNTILALQNQTLVLLCILTGSLIADLIVFSFVWNSKSSFIKQSSDVSFMALLETFDPESLCPFC